MLQLFCANVLDKISPDPEKPSTELHIGNSLDRDGVERIAEVVGYVIGIERRPQRGQGLDPVNPLAERKRADPQRKWLQQETQGHNAVGHVGSGCDDIRNVRRKRGVGEFSLGMTKAA